MANYQPFLISQFKSGLFQYLQPWIRPQEAFEPLDNAFVYRGVLQKRAGYEPLGVLYCETGVVIGTGSGITTYSGTLLDFPIEIGSFNPSATTTSGVETFVDNEDGTLTGSLGGFGTIVYTTGAWALTFAAPVNNPNTITAAFCIPNGRLAYKDFIATGDGVTHTFSGTLLVHPILGGSLSITDGTETFTDNADGTLTGSLGGAGTIVYSTGVWSVTFNSAPANHRLIYATFNQAQLTGSRPIMGIKQWTNESTAATTLIVMDTRRASVFNNNTNMFVPLDTVVQVLWVGDGSSTSFTATTGWTAVSPYTQVFVPRSVSISDGPSTIVDDGAGNLSASGNFAAGGTVNYGTGVITLNFVAAPANTVTITLTVTLAGDYFHGTPSNFFNATNWIAPERSPPSGTLYMTNNVDPITTFDGTNLARPPFSTSQANYLAFVNNIQTCLDIDVYKNRLLIQRPTLLPGSVVAGQSIRYSALQQPTNLVADVPGNGGELSAPTDDFIQSSEFLRDQLIVFFGNSTWSFRFTGSSFDPFVWTKLNVSKSTNAPYGTIPYDERITAMGAKGLIACDGVNVQRYDINIIDEFLAIRQSRFQQCYGLRFDNSNQSWMLFPSDPDIADPEGDLLSDSALIYNFLENTWAVYSIRMSCLGLYHLTKDAVWNDFAPDGIYGPLSWNQANFPWDYYLEQSLAPELLGGGQDGVVYQLERGNTDFGTPITATVTSTQWNPFTNLGEKIQFGYIDFYYAVQPDCQIELQFFVDNSTAPAAIRSLTLDGSATNVSKGMKRIYINAMGEFLQMQMTSSSAAPFQILGMVLWARQAGRLTP